MRNNQKIINELIKSNYKAVFVITGGGVSALSSILKTPGASAFVLECQIPYSKDALNSFLEESLDKTCTPQVSNQLALKAYHRAQNYSHESDLVMGIACTAALQTNRIRKGKDCAHLSLYFKNHSFSRCINLSHDSRENQEDILCYTLLNYIKECINIAS